MAGRKRRDWLQSNVGTFLRQYARKAQRGQDPNDRNYDRRLEKELKDMDPEELGRILSGDDDDSDTAK